MIQKNEIYDLKITGMTSEGNGVGKIDDFAVFVPSTVIGDAIKVKIVKVLKRYAFGIIENICEPSQNHIAVDCSVNQQCGGCSFRHMSYESELSVKQMFVLDALKRIGKIHVKPEAIIGGVKINRYRNKAQLPISTEKNNEILAGFYAKRSHRLVPYDDCLLQPEIFNEIASFSVEFFQKSKISAYNEKTHTGYIRNLYLRIGKSTGEIMVCLVLAQKKMPFEKKFIDELIKRFHKVVSVVFNYNPEKTNVILGKEERVAFGKETIIDQVGKLRYEISPQSFYQINHEQMEKLYEIVKNFARLTGKENVVDIYCGAGTIGLYLAEKAQKVIGIEIVSAAVKNAEKNALINSLTNCEFWCCDAKKGAERLIDEKYYADLVIIDPPRKGCDQNVLKAISQIKPKRIIMISCNPATMARDCQSLLEEGFIVAKIQPIDMFPRTPHVETIVLLSRK